MARQKEDLRDWVLWRWPGTLAEAIRIVDDRRQRGHSKKSRPPSIYLCEPTTPTLTDRQKKSVDDRECVLDLDFRKSIAVPQVAALISSAKEERRVWERSLHRWLQGTRAPEPDLIQELFTALNLNCIIGLGRAGYQQHAIFLLHGLWANGAKTLAARSARGIFSGLGDEPDDRFKDDEWLLSDEDHLRIGRAIARCWPKQKGLIPKLPTPSSSSDFLASPKLFEAYALLDAALNMTLSVAKRRIYTVQGGVAQRVLSWAIEIEPAKSVGRIPA